MQEDKSRSTTARLFPKIRSSAWMLGRRFPATDHPHCRRTLYNSAQAARPARPTKAPAATWPASDFPEAVGEVAPVEEPVPEALLEVVVDSEPLELELELEPEPPLDEDEIWWEEVMLVAEDQGLEGFKSLRSRW